mmetsp:Transcript_27650/g.58425  ORF Transcript_27650/g.58425 Transcript_27650/m.58425 type:complete len:80 (+) Transcript_27650:1178-1417(+)
MVCQRLVGRGGEVKGGRKASETHCWKKYISAKAVTRLASMPMNAKARGRKINLLYLYYVIRKNDSQVVWYLPSTILCVA